MGNIHPLVPLCLSPDVEVIHNIVELVEELDSLAPHRERPVLITQVDNRYLERFIKSSVSECPSTDLLSHSLPKNWRVAQKYLLTHKKIPEHIVRDVYTHDYQIVILLLVDGLSYFDVQKWVESNQPCFVNGPSITYFEHRGRIIEDVGFPALIGSPTIARRLSKLGIARPYGFSYWSREHNKVSDFLFRGMSLERVSSIEVALSSIETSNLSGAYIQIVREGLDGLAHHRREVSTDEIEATVAAIHQDYRHLIQIVARTGLRGSIYLTSDHGILWKKQHDFEKVYVGRGQHSRYMLGVPEDLAYFSKRSFAHQSFYLCHYPYLAAHIPANDSGVHGGLSAWESIVPFVQVEVNI